MPDLSSSSARELLGMARQTLETFVSTGKISHLETADQALKKPGACFVTLREKGMLRGCVGHLKAEAPLYEEVMRMVRAAASEDYRFPAVEKDEVNQITLEISVLSPFEKVGSAKDIVVGRHGIMLERGNQRGVFLPEVAPEMEWNAEEFVKACAREKLRLPESAWPETTLYRFTTQKIKETR